MIFMPGSDPEERATVEDVMARVRPAAEACAPFPQPLRGEIWRVLVSYGATHALTFHGACEIMTEPCDRDSLDPAQYVSIIPNAIDKLSVLPSEYAEAAYERIRAASEYYHVVMPPYDHCDGKGWEPPADALRLRMSTSIVPGDRSAGE